MSRAMSETAEGASPYDPPRAAQAPWWRRAARRYDRGLERLVEKVPSVQDPHLAAVLSVAPGLGHLCLERRPGKAALLFCAYGALLTWAWLFSRLDSFWTGALLLSFHQWVVSDCAARARALSGLPRLSGKPLMKFSLLVGLALLLLYRQVGAASGQWGAAVYLTDGRFAPTLNAGDRLLISREPAYRRGDIVYSGTYLGLERVIGMPGDEIAVKNGLLLVNGAPPPRGQGPLSGEIFRALHGATLQVPPGRYCVLFPVINHGLAGSNFLSRFMIPGANLDGRLSLRYYPEVTRFP